MAHALAALLELTVAVAGLPRHRHALCRSPHEPSWAVAFRPDGRAIATTHHDGVVQVWDAATGRPTLTFQAHEPCRDALYSLRAVAYSPDGTRLVTAGGDRTVRIWDANG